MSKILLEKIIAEAQKNYNAIYLESHSKLQSALVLYKKYEFDALEAPLPQSEHSLMDHWMIKKNKLKSNPKNKSAIMNLS